VKNLKESLAGVQFHSVEKEQVVEMLQSDGSKGLTEQQIEGRKDAFGKNELKEEKKKTLLQKFLEQFNNLMVIILMIAGAISGFMEEITDTIVILLVVVINAVLGVVQESKAEKALDALKKMSSPFAKIIRNGSVMQIKSEDIMVGDIVLLEAGDYVPADLRILESNNLKIDEAPLTGESVPVEKIDSVIDKKDTVIGDRRNMAYFGCSVTYGRGVGIVTAIGMDTELGKIAGHLASDKESQTPLQVKMAEMSKFLTIAILITCVVVFSVGALRGREYLEMFLTAVSLAVAAIPEGLPAVITIVLAMGVQKMAKQNAIIRKLSAVETLGCTQIICSDKTGTLTQNKMTVTEVYANKTIKNVNDIQSKDQDLNTLIRALVLCNDSRLNTEGEGIEILGDPTETALIRFAYEKGYYEDKEELLLVRKAELPFDSNRKLMTTFNQEGNQYLAFTKGAPDVLLNKCTSILTGSEIRPITEEDRAQIIDANKQMASKALRVLGTAFRAYDVIPAELKPETVEENLVFIGLIGMIDPPRPEVKDAVGICKEAGIRAVMITGDHRDTAAAIAKELNIASAEDEIITGAELDLIPEDRFESLVTKYSVYARVSPEHKVRIVKAWKKQGKIVAMTGDGVNDAPALKSSDIGVGMGITGTDVAKGVSNMVLADDNFATIVSAVKEGRKIYSNIRKSIQFLLSSNLGEVLTLFIGTMLNWVVLLPIHILWINLVTDTLPALALGMEKSEKDVMKQKPRSAKDSFFSGGVGASVIYQGILESMITLGAFYYGLTHYSKEIATTMAFATLGMIQLSHAFNVRSIDKSLFRIGFFGNRYLNIAVLISGIMQLGVIIVPFFNRIFKVEHLNSEQWMIVVAAALIIIPAVELVKLIMNIAKPGKAKAE